MNYLLDMTEPPTVTQAQAMRDLGYTGLGVYVGGPRAAAHDHWHQVDGVISPVGRLASIFDGFVPITVGRNVPWDGPLRFTLAQGEADAAQGNLDTGACGFGSFSPMVLDVEYGTYEKYPVAVDLYIAGYVEVANAAGHPVWLYGDLTLANHYAGRSDLIDGFWLADQFLFGNDLWAPVGSFDPATPPPTGGTLLWQYGNGIVAGVAVDYNSAADGIVLAKYEGTMAS